MKWETLKAWTDVLIEAEDSRTLNELSEYFGLAEKKSTFKARGIENDRVNDCLDLAERSVRDQLE